MPNSRRFFCKNSLYFGLGISLFPLISEGNTTQSGMNKAFSLRKNKDIFVKIKGRICYGGLIPAKNVILEIWHSNSENTPSSFEYQGNIIADKDGYYSFETDFPEKYVEDGHIKMRRIFFKVNDNNEEKLETALFFGENGNAYIDNLHIDKSHDAFKFELPKTIFENSKVPNVEFNIYLKA